MDKDLLIRVQSGQHGTARISVRPSDPSCVLYGQVEKEFGIPDRGWALYKQRTAKLGDEVRRSRSKSIREFNLRHGDMLYLIPKSKSVLNDLDSGASTSAAGNGAGRGTAAEGGAAVAGLPNPSVKEDDVDVQLDKKDGKIGRSRNEQMCRHGPSGKCLHCVPLEPFDESYLKSCDPPIKFLSFHSYIRKLRSGVDKGKFVNLENLSCKIKDCKEHAPWPAGICTKCQPNAITLNRQAYRHIDFVQFENGNIMDRFLNYWRQSGCQRMGYLMGRYEQHPDMPLAIKAVVCCIYEPPQNCSRNSIELLDDPNEQLVDDLASELGLRRVGWIFTDLSVLDLTKGSVKHTRGSIESYFLSAEECITAAALQNRYPNKCRWSSDGVFGSKFVTVVVTGDKDNQIHFEGYQVSDQCMGLVRDECLVPTYDAPELGYVKDSTSRQYVPDVFYKEKDKYSNEVTRLARPLPVEYLLTDMSAAFPREQTYSLTALGLSQEPFPACNRIAIGYPQDLSSLATYMHQFDDSQFLEAVSDFNLLLFLALCDVLPMREHLAPLLSAVKDQNRHDAALWSQGEQWSTMTHLLQASVPSPTPTAAAAATSGGASYFGPNSSPLPPIGSSWEYKKLATRTKAFVALSAGILLVKKGAFIARRKAQIIDGKKIAAEIKDEVRTEIQRLLANGKRAPHLTAIQVGTDPASSTYIKNKMKATEEVGISSETLKLDETISQDHLVQLIKEKNCDNSIDGLLVQLPVPAHISERAVCNAVAPNKDVDGFHLINVGRFCTDLKSLLPATPAGIMELIRRSGIETFGKNAVVCGRSKNVGMPIAMLLHADGIGETNAGDATTTICHRYTPREQLLHHVRYADILVVATGIPGLIQGDMIKEGCAIIDVGINRIKDPKTGKTKLVGDCDFKSCSEVAGWITPVPGGVGPMTVAMLMKNTLQAAMGTVHYDM